MAEVRRSVFLGYGERATKAISNLRSRVSPDIVDDQRQTLPSLRDALLLHLADKRERGTCACTGEQSRCQPRAASCLTTDCMNRSAGVGVLAGTARLVTRMNVGIASTTTRHTHMIGARSICKIKGWKRFCKGPNAVRCNMIQPFS